MKLNVVAIDDEPIYLNLIELFLKNAGYYVTTIEGGQAGIRYLSQHEEVIDVILLDLMMPDIHGFDVLFFIRNHPALKTIPVILQSATPNEEDFHQGLKLGASACVRKPYSVTELLEVVSKALQ